MKVNGGIGDSGQPVGPASGTVSGGNSAPGAAASAQGTQPALNAAPQRATGAEGRPAMTFARSKTGPVTPEAGEVSYTDYESMPTELKAAYGAIAEGAMRFKAACEQHGITDKSARDMLHAVEQGVKAWSLQRAELDTLMAVEYNTETTNNMGLIRLPRIAPALGAGHPLDIKLIRRTFIENLDPKLDVVPRANMTDMKSAYDQVRQGILSPDDAASSCHITHPYDTKLLEAVSKELSDQYMERVSSKTLQAAQQAISKGATAYDAAERFGAGNPDDYRVLHLWDCAMSNMRGLPRPAVWYPKTREPN